MSNTYSGMEAVFFDLNGTTIPEESDMPPLPDVAEAIKQAGRNTRMIVATGMSIARVFRVCKPLELIWPMIVTDGSQTIDPISRDVVWVQPLGAEVIATAHKFASSRRLDWNCRLPGSDEKITSPSNEALAFTYKDIPMEFGPEVERVFNDMPVNISFFSSKIQPDRCVDAKVSHVQATKGQAASVLMGDLGIDSTKTACIGNELNDLPLFSTVGVTYAVGNAHPEVKKAADHMVSSQECGGIIDMLESLHLSNMRTPHTD